MQLVERHVIKRTDARFVIIDAAAFASKNLYNAANYVVRQSFIHEGIYLNYHEMHRRMKDHEAYKALPAKVAQWVLRLLGRLTKVHPVHIWVRTDAGPPRGMKDFCTFT